MRFLIILWFLLPFSLYSQTWKFENAGNAFDGFGKLAFAENSPYDNQKGTIGVVNYSAKRVIKWGDLGENGLDNLNLKLILKDRISPEKIMIAFDDEKVFYILNFIDNEKSFSVLNAYTKDYKKFLSLLDIISNLKVKKTIHIRAIEGDNRYDYNFSLDGSVNAINQSFICPDYKKSGNWTDAFYEHFHFASLFTKIDNGKKNLVSYGNSCSEYLGKKFGTYFFTQINFIESDSDVKYPKLTFKNYQGEIVAEIDTDIILKK
jgi:hypothetical protein